MEEGQPAVLGIQARNHEVREMLARAQRHLGIENRASFARLLNQATGGDGPDESTYNRWMHEDSRIIPGWAPLAAAQVAGVSVDYLRSGEQATPELLQRMDEFEARLATVLGQLQNLGPIYEELKRLKRAERARRGRSVASNG